MTKGKTKPKTILIVEDEKPLLDAISIKMQKSGYETVSARTVEQALNYLNDIQKINVIWLDHYLLGKESGLDFLVKIKGDKNYKDIPVFVVSNTAGHDKITSYLNLGAVKFYVKAEKRLDEIINDINKYITN
ncbi:MAG: Phosphate regulon transcriptional regulatory protein PhoB [Parcubacteria group bacterium ADurb.Bin316]|nr:MAG: Phosphate regulon transcriptional regulatory protein PhoB [Parcubacteria group bacterium ADurb.Bin316]HOZ55748.1 response regulator [bacterium]